MCMGEGNPHKDSAANQLAFGYVAVPLLVCSVIKCYHCFLYSLYKNIQHHLEFTTAFDSIISRSCESHKLIKAVKHCFLNFI